MDPLSALKRTLALVESSRTSPWATEGVETLAQKLRDAIAAFESGTPADRAELRVLFLPTGALQETSNDNGWGDEFLLLAESLDAFLR